MVAITVFFSFTFRETLKHCALFTSIDSLIHSFILSVKFGLNVSLLTKSQQELSHSPKPRFHSSFSDYRESQRRPRLLTPSHRLWPQCERFPGALLPLRLPPLLLPLGRPVLWPGSWETVRFGYSIQHHCIFRPDFFHVVSCCLSPAVMTPGG